MAIPSYKSIAITSSGTGDVVAVLPTYSDDDILILIVETANQSVSTPSGWTAFTHSPKGTGTAGDTAATACYLFWLRASGSVSAPTITDPGDHAILKVISYSGCKNTGDPYDVIATTSGTGTSVTFPEVTTSENDCLIVLIGTDSFDGAGNRLSAQTNANLSSIAERFDNGAVAGNGGGIWITDGGKASAGATGTTSATLSFSVTWVSVTFALQPYTAPTGIVYTVTETDGMQFYDGAPVKEQQSFLTDPLFMLDAVSRLNEKTIAESLFADDSSTSALERTAHLMEGLLMLDTRRAEMSLIRNDSMLLDDSYISKSLEKILADGLLLADNVIALKEFIAYVVDSIMLVDSVAKISQLDRYFLEGLLVADSLSKMLESFLTDKIFLSDNSIIERIIAGLDIIMTDTLFMLDSRFSDRSSSNRESLLLQDQSIKDLIRSMTDYLISTDSVVRTAEMSFIEHIMLNDILVRAQEMVMYEGLMLYDVAALQRLILGTQFLVYARLSSNNLLGVALDSQDFIGSRTETCDLMGRMTSHNRWRL